MGNRLICDPTSCDVNPGDSVVWRATLPVAFFFPDDTPFVEGRGPFEANKGVTVKADACAATYTPTVVMDGEVHPPQGDIVVKKGKRA
jgi:hypothetical protein